MKKFIELKTITGRIIKVVPNYSKRTFTIQTEASRFRTLPLSKDEFNSCLYNTGHDWNNFLKSDDYYLTKK